MHEEALTERGKHLFPRLSNFKDFYLVGGTALALQLGHRLSVDFDMFTAGELPSQLLRKTKKVFNDSAVFVTYSVPGQLNITVDDIKTTFFEYPYAVVQPFVKHQDVALLTVEEIAATKALSIGKRLAYKDYVDWYFMLAGNHINLSQVIELARHKFGNDFNDRLFLSQLVSMEDIQEQPIHFLDKPVSRETISGFLQAVVQNFEL